MDSTIDSFGKRIDDGIKEKLNMVNTYVEEKMNSTKKKLVDPIESKVYDVKNNIIAPYLKKREEKRRKEYKAVDKYEIPKRVLNIKDVENDLSYVDKYLGLE